ncbi:MAG: c-type cytochrome, partial [Roseiarcus sp.]|uniref:c-type cytochrome n=1 Tax=Roseiarcus sp. TaxID=1969460 RepID=UPI003C3D9A20
RTLGGLQPEQGVDVAAGKKVFADNCAACHGDDAKGNIEMGAPNLTTKVWQYGSDINDLIYTISNARNSVMPAWGKRLDPVTIKSLAVYVHSLGGGT